nr:MAG TPA: hypothetical protein [Bacteriophage sp.]
MTIKENRDIVKIRKKTVIKTDFVSRKCGWFCWYLDYIIFPIYLQSFYLRKAVKKCTKNLLCYWKKPTKLFIGFLLIQE